MIKALKNSWKAYRDLERAMDAFRSIVPKQGEEMTNEYDTSLMEMEEWGEGKNEYEKYNSGETFRKHENKFQILACDGEWYLTEEEIPPNLGLFQLIKKVEKLPKLLAYRSGNGCVEFVVDGSERHGGIRLDQIYQRLEKKYDIDPNECKCEDSKND